jgi:hypothetical protein
MRWAGHVARMEEKYIRSFARKTRKEETTSKPSRECEDSIKMNLKRNRVEGCRVDSYVSGQAPEVGCCEHGNEPLG